MHKALIGSLIFFFCHLTHAAPITYLVLGESKIFEFLDNQPDSSGGYLQQDANTPLYRNDGSIFFNGDTHAYGMFTIDQDSFTPTSSDPSSNYFFGNVSWVFFTEGMKISLHSYPEYSDVWPYSAFTENSYHLADDAPGEPDVFSISLYFEGTPFKSNFLNGDFSMSNFALATTDGTLVNLKGSITQVVPMPVAVPEPTSLGLLLVGLLGLAFVRKRKSVV